MLATILAVYGAWDDAPTAWRILPAEEYDNDISWYVRELEVYASPGCTGDKIAPHKTLGSLGGSDSIVDGNVETPWNTRTLSSKFAARAHYVGFQVLKANALHGNCVKLNQGSLHGGTSGLARMIVLRTPTLRLHARIVPTYIKRSVVDVRLPRVHRGAGGLRVV